MANQSINVEQESGVDELERLAMEDLVRRCRFGAAPSCLVIPAARGNLSSELARLGGVVVAADTADTRQDIIGRALSAGLKDEVIYTEADFSSLPDHFPEEPFDIIFCRRGLNFLPYREAKERLRQLISHLKIGGKIYLSLLGLHSELGDGYRGVDNFVQDRFTPLAPLQAKKYGTDSPLCLYSERDLFLLLMEAGGGVLRTFTTTYGNVKGVAVRV